MAYAEPGRLQVMAETLMLNGLLSRMYSSYVESMGLSGNERVLELGPGSGAATKHLAPRLRERGQLTEVDITRAWVERLRRRYGNGAWIDYVCADVRQSPLEPGSSDIVLVHWMLHDVDASDRETVMAALARLLRSGGRLFLREPVKESHGMSVSGIRRLTSAVGLQEVACERGKNLFAGPYFAGVYVRF
jgi:ubiquinone/menaquinone biosynthesis C-methylase UbiE